MSGRRRFGLIWKGAAALELLAVLMLAAHYEKQSTIELNYPDVRKGGDHSSRWMEGHIPGQKFEAKDSVSHHTKMFQAVVQPLGSDPSSTILFDFAQNAATALVFFALLVPLPRCLSFPLCASTFFVVLCDTGLLKTTGSHINLALLGFVCSQVKKPIKPV
jgi:hypothetical protein